jgi:hypothetical protein
VAERAGGPGVEGTVEGVAFVGAQVHTHVEVDGGHGTFVTTAAPGGPQTPVGARVRLTWETEAATILPR